MYSLCWFTGAIRAPLEHTRNRKRKQPIQEAL